MKTRWESRMHMALLAGLAVLLIRQSASAHHATAVGYDVSKTVVLKGTITRVDWFNPHIHVTLDVRLDGSHHESWSIEFPSPGATIVAGLSKRQLAPGTVLTFEGYPSRETLRSSSDSAETTASSEQHFACATAITFPDGTRYGFVVGV